MTVAFEFPSHYSSVFFAIRLSFKVNSLGFTACLLTSIICWFMLDDLQNLSTIYMQESKKRLKLVSIGIAPHDGIFSIGVSPHGIISIGAIPHGLISIGLAPMGVISMGLVSMGLVSVGTVSMGLLSIGRSSMSILQLDRSSFAPQEQSAPNAADHEGMGH
ncbi:hypothetical protein [Microcoleus sp. FACHB-1515]|uniref:hypothetical protein n=1 Tax=Cyanophyceae TaxID=3028117 RepID=UPI0018F00F39|nr:hypothetical protein [Microcoleus sp. FACHB-1515]